MQNTSEKIYSLKSWAEKQEVLITSLKSQPIILVLRLSKCDLEDISKQKSLFRLIEELNHMGLKHIEITWMSHPNWKSFMRQIQEYFPSIYLGAASIKSSFALKSLIGLNLDYAMTPFWDTELLCEAIKLNQLLIPGAFSPTEVYSAIKFGCKLIKLFPAKTLGVDYLHQLQGPIGSLPFLIAAGGLKITDTNEWLARGYGAVALGRELIKKQTIDPKLQIWIKTYSNKS